MWTLRIICFSNRLACIIALSKYLFLCINTRVQYVIPAVKVIWEYVCNVVSLKKKNLNITSVCVYIKKNNLVVHIFYKKNKQTLFWTIHLELGIRRLRFLIQGFGM